MTTNTTVNSINWPTHRFTEDAVLCFIRSENRLMLIRKKTGLGAGKINAPGGRIESGEAALNAAIRETQEEIGLTPSGLRQVAELNFIFTDGYSLRGFVFFANSFTGTPISTPEADPMWCDIDKIPYGEMWADDIHWLPRVLAGEKIVGRFIFDGERMMDGEVVVGDS